jgi:hypothetical protein
MFVVYLFFGVLSEVISRYGLAALAISVILTLGAGVVVYFSGGAALKGMLYTAIGCVSFSALAAVFTVIGALSKPW